MERRSFLARSAAVAGGSVIAAGPFQGLVAAQAAPAGSARPSRPGSLRPVADDRDGQVRLHLAPGFSYRSFAAVGDPMDDDHASPARPDGMAAFRGWGGTTVLVRNHEVPGTPGAFGDLSRAYDAAGGGGTTTLTVDRNGRLVDSRVSLNGTIMNCSGGPMPWGAWVTAEESVDGPDVKSPVPGADNKLLKQKHGYLFEVPVRGRGTMAPIRSAGRFQHESAAFDPVSGALYLTEDDPLFASGFYRYLPPVHPMRAGRILDGGRLQMLAVAGTPRAQLHLGQPKGAAYQVTWVDIDDPDPTFAPGATWFDAAPTVSREGQAKGAAVFSRLEGSVYDQGSIYFVSTQGGDAAPGDEFPPGPGGLTAFGAGRGQVWAYDIRRERLRLVYQSPHSSVLDMPDNIAVTPHGTLILCEDGENENYLRGLTARGDLVDIARLAPVELDPDAEFAGATFDPDGRTLYVNIQSKAGCTIAIRGPWI
ncbi:alkaline phosphatase PhoX [Yinghuangia soli]|uniref:PhoX family protein n=1 Tax=Yinghuangia soli TaxID=2908204 RepID=A0AA41U2N6_9ACTN|nr:alkaline phosphatase PhoX [Yinghuangia soli]MCF2530880.1 PhoX family protein [Yinghuangia soli]